MVLMIELELAGGLVGQEFRGLRMLGDQTLVLAGTTKIRDLFLITR